LAAVAVLAALLAAVAVLAVIAVPLLASYLAACPAQKPDLLQYLVRIKL
jgi:hypothetical protein